MLLTNPVVYSKLVNCNLKKKTMNSIIPGITMFIGKCLGIYSRRMSAIRSLYSLLLIDGFATGSINFLTIWYLIDGVGWVAQCTFANNREA